MLVVNIQCLKANINFNNIVLTRVVQLVARD
jgi:hypothetical protein